MKWIEKVSNVKRNGVNIKSYEAKTPLMTFHVYESLSGGEFFYYHTRETNGGRDPYNEFGHPRHKCKSFEEGKEICEKAWQKLKEDIIAA